MFAKTEIKFPTAPDLLTFLRILLIPIIIGLLFLKNPHGNILAGIAFSAASITDYFDGYLARLQKVETLYGKLMDPLADKFLIVSSLIMLQEIGKIHPITVILLICREIAITGLRALASAEGIIIETSLGAKWKTATQMIAIPCIMAQSGVFGLPLGTLGIYLLHLSLGISLWSAKNYWVTFFQSLHKTKNKKKEPILRQMSP